MSETKEKLLENIKNAWVNQNNMSDEELSEIKNEIISNLEFEGFAEVDDFEFDECVSIEIRNFQTNPVISYEATATDSEGNKFTCIPEFDFDSIEMSPGDSWSFSGDVFMGIENPPVEWGLIWSFFDPIVNKFSETPEYKSYIASKRND